MSCDHLHEKYRDLTPYQYAANNPIILFDRNGLYFDFSMIKNPDEVAAMKAYISEIKSTDAGRSMIVDIEKSTSPVRISIVDKITGSYAVDNPNGLTKPDFVSNADGTSRFAGATVTLDRSTIYAKDDVEYASNVAMTAHEFRHVQQAMNGPTGQGSDEYKKVQKKDEKKSYYNKTLEKDAYKVDGKVFDQVFQKSKTYKNLQKTKKLKPVKSIVPKEVKEKQTR